MRSAQKNYLEDKGNVRDLRVYQCLKSDSWHITKQHFHQGQFKLDKFKQHFRKHKSHRHIEEEVY